MGRRRGSPWVVTEDVAKVIEDLLREGYTAAGLGRTADIHERHIYRIRARTYPRCSYSIAEQILLRTGMEHKLYDGSIRDA